MVGPFDNFDLPRFGKPNPDLAERDPSAQPNYAALSREQRDIVDRAIHGKVFDGTGTSPRFSQAIIAEFKGAPDSLQIEKKIEDLREQYSADLKNGGQAAKSRLNALGADAPAANIARVGLNLVILFNGEETCGCRVKGAAIDLGKVVTPSTVQKMLIQRN